ncbi:MCE family protein [Hoyosella rhizosphaerae]|uniref:ABC transporter substrate-binding protein n=1 Tax=Hoyosella rhizosphaerae TaxID=1755582 RepID=A0A916XJY8_9ACTN|nr:MlaD family protein [Hoyosella rhizosphaerae]MBN4927821.1 MCE family protein [Hoyosella rhizosphaerae]GGC76842.1 ABC transporter substrate-binding protein [Hoyosella rhizosphaerae]
MRGLAAPLIKLALFAIITISAVAVLAVAIANYIPTSGHTYKARFTDVTSLEKGDEIRIAGVRIGKVTDIKLADRDQAEVEFQIRDGLELPSDVNAAIRYRHLAGQRYVLLSRGSGTEAGNLEPGSTIPLDRTTPAVNLTVMFNGFRPLFQTLQPEDVNRLADQIIQIFQGESATITQLVANVGTLTNAIADKDEVIGEVVNNLNSVLERVNEHDDDIREMVSSLDILVSGLADDRDTVGSAVQSLSVLTQELTELLEPTRPSIQGTISGVEQLAGNLNANSATVERTIQNLPVKLERIGKTASLGSWFSMYLCGLDIIVGPGTPTGVNLPGGIPTVNQPLYTNAADRCQPGGIQ